MPFGGNDWLALTREPALEPELPICDPHHHFWDFRTTRIPYQRACSTSWPMTCAVATTCVPRFSLKRAPCTARTAPRRCARSARLSSSKAWLQRAPVVSMAPDGLRRPSTGWGPSRSGVARYHGMRVAPSPLVNVTDSSRTAGMTGLPPYWRNSGVTFDARGTGLGRGR